MWSKNKDFYSIDALVLHFLVYASHRLHISSDENLKCKFLQKVFLYIFLNIISLKFGIFRKVCASFFLKINFVKKQATDLGVALPASVNSIDKEVASGIAYMNNRIKKLTIATQVGK